MFRRSKAAEAPTTPTTLKEGGKGRPTPSRREAQAAAKARAKGPQDRKAAAKLDRQRRSELNARAREGMKTGDDRYLPARDKGPVRRFVRDYIDARLSIAEFLLPLLLVIMLLQYSGNAALVKTSSQLWGVTLLMVTLDTGWLLFRIKRALRAKFPDESLKGTTFYTVLRVLQLRWLRMPKPQVKIGGARR